MINIFTLFIDKMVKWLENTLQFKCKYDKV